MKNIGNYRRDYLLSELRLKDLSPNPMEQFNLWFEKALKENIQDANVMVLSTLDKFGYPSSRILLLKGLQPEGLEAYTNLDSRKAIELKQTPKASLHFYWKELERQIRIKCNVFNIPDTHAVAYFETRPRESQISAWVSDQSHKVDNKKYLLDRYKFFETKFSGKKIPKPDNWGGYMFKPISYIFWQGGEKRLHDVFEYTMHGEQWNIKRVGP